MFAQRIAGTEKTTAEDKIRTAYRAEFGRALRDVELQEGIRFLVEQTRGYGTKADAQLRAFTDFCQVHLCLNELIYID